MLVDVLFEIFYDMLIIYFILSCKSCVEVYVFACNLIGVHMCQILILLTFTRVTTVRKSSSYLSLRSYIEKVKSIYMLHLSHVSNYLNLYHFLAHDHLWDLVFDFRVFSQNGPSTIVHSQFCIWLSIAPNVDGLRDFNYLYF